eukprot:2920692-Amphidinium_carterae.1
MTDNENRRKHKIDVIKESLLAAQRDAALQMQRQQEEIERQQTEALSSPPPPTPNFKKSDKSVPKAPRKQVKTELFGPFSDFLGHTSAVEGRLKCEFQWISVVGLGGKLARMLFEAMRRRQEAIQWGRHLVAPSPQMRSLKETALTCKRSD